MSIWPLLLALLGFTVSLIVLGLVLALVITTTAKTLTESIDAVLNPQKPENPSPQQQMTTEDLPTDFTAPAWAQWNEYPEP